MAVTLLPAFLVLAGARGWIAPRRDLATRFWRDAWAAPIDIDGAEAGGEKASGYRAEYR